MYQGDGKSVEQVEWEAARVTRQKWWNLPGGLIYWTFLKVIHLAL